MDESNVPEQNGSFKNKTVDGASGTPHSEDDRGPCCHEINGQNRNLIVCIDGTANKFGLKNTNVIELYNLILKEGPGGHNQHTWYNSGIGTYARPSWKSLRYYRKVLYHKIDLLIAWDFEKTVCSAYRWLSDNYMPGDCIFLFGFSRGAFQVRVLSAMIDKVGLIHKGNENQIPFAYELYADPKTDKPSSSLNEVGSPETHRNPSWFEHLKEFFSKENQKEQTEDDISMAKRFKKAFSHKSVRVHFVGAWDTVSSIGIARGTHMLPGTVDGMKHVCYFRHALALDERRVKFSPEYAFGGSARAKTKSDQNPLDKDRQDRNLSTGTIMDGPISSATPNDPLPPAQNKDEPKVTYTSVETFPHTMEVWFAGTHSDIGGGNVYNAAMNRSRPPLRWMVFQSGIAGLRTELFDRVLLPSEQVEIKESLTCSWWILELFPLRRLTYTRKEDGKKTTHKPHLGSSRKIHVGQKIHGSITRTNKHWYQYIPKARPVNNDPSFWENVRKEGLGIWLAADMYETTQTLIENFVSSGLNDESLLQILEKTASSGDGRQAVYESVIEAIMGKESKPPLEMTADIKYQFVTKAIKIMKSTARNDRSLKPYCSASIWTSLADLWGTDKKEYQDIARQFIEHFGDACQLPLYELEGHTKEVQTVAFSPDGKQIISGSNDSIDKNLWMWDCETGTKVGKPLQVHTDWVRSAAFSSDGKYASGSYDKTIQIWHADTADGEPLRGRQKWVTSVAFSPDNKRLASGMGNTLQIWDVEGRKAAGEPLQGHTDIVTSVAFSPDGQYIASGSYDTTVRIWDANTNLLVGNPLQGHSLAINSVAFSPDSRLIVTGSNDSTARIWDVEMKEEIIKMRFQRHNHYVLSVAFLPDGKRVVSGSFDRTVRIWDVQTGVIENTFHHRDRVYSVAFSPGGELVVSGSENGRVRIWDALSNVGATRHIWPPNRRLVGRR